MTPCLRIIPRGARGAQSDPRRSAGPRLFAGLLVLLAITLAVLPASRAAAAVSAPSATTSYAAKATYSSVVVYGYVNPHGNATGYSFQYGTTTGYGGQTSLAPAGKGTATIKVSQTITGLQPGTIYHYRIAAVNGAGLTYGNDRTFRTANVPLSLSITGVPNPVTYGEPFLVEGNLTGTGAANRELTLESNPFPYTAGFHAVGNPEVTNSTGGFSFPYLGLLENAQLRVATTGTGTVVVSPIVTESVAVKVTFHAARTRRRGWVRLSGTVSPAEVGALVGFQLLQPGNSLNQGGTGVVADTTSMSKFSRTVHVRPGVYRALVKLTNDGAHVSAYSPPIFVR
jgi:hypothetical protein